jgi:hypothetical protein
MADSGPPAATADTRLIQYLAVPRLSAGQHPTAVQLALHAGWTMAVLFGSETTGGAPPTPVLPSISQLPPLERRQLELRRLHLLLSSLSARPECAQSDLNFAAASMPADAPEFRDHIALLHRQVLAALSVTTGEVELAYELGHQLRDTTWLTARAYARAQEQAHPGAKPEEIWAMLVARQLDRTRIEIMQARLSTLAADLPAHVATIVAASLGRWSVIAREALGSADEIPAKQPPANVVWKLRGRLPAQGELWLTLLISANPTAGLRTSRRIVNKVLRRNGEVLVIPAALLAVALYLIFTYTSGVATVLTAIAAIAGSLGFSARGIGALVGTLFIRDTNNPVFRQGEEDAMISDITSIPPLSLSLMRVRRLRRAGVDGS